MSFYRKPSPLEITYAGTDTEDFSPFVNQFFIEGEGDFDLEQWQQAALKSAEANPGVRLQMKGFWGFKYWDDQGPTPQVIEIETEWDGNSSEGAYLGEPIYHRTGPNAQILLMKGKKNRVLFRTHHAITDGKGAVHWMEEVFRALRGEPLLGSSGTYNEWTIVKDMEYPPRSITEGHCIPVTKPAKDPSIGGCRWTRLILPGKHPKILAKLMLAIGNIAWRTNGEDGKVVFRLPSDLRRYAGKDAPFSMANNTGTIDLQIDSTMTPTSLQKAIVRAMRTKADLSVFPKNMYLANWVPMKLFRFRPELYQRKHAEVNYRMTGIISFLGDMEDLSAFSYDGFKATGFYGIPIPLEDRAIVIGLTLNESNGLDAVVTVPKALATQDELNALCEDIKAELIKLNN